MATSNKMTMNLQGKTIIRRKGKTVYIIRVTTKNFPVLNLLDIIITSRFKAQVNSLMTHAETTNKENFIIVVLRRF
jgi:hypothetical protein